MKESIVYILSSGEHIAMTSDLSPEITSTLKAFEIARKGNAVYHVASLNLENASDLEHIDFLPKRDLIASVDNSTQSIIVRGLQMLYWHEKHQRCGACGDILKDDAHKDEKVCISCAARYYPTVSPAIIVLIRKGDEMLLSRSPHFPPGMYGLIAGYVEPGESAEGCIHREVLEEVGIEVNNIRYFGSQPWPTPSSLMLGFTADYVSGEITLQDDELEDAAWFSKDNLPRLPIKASIAAQMIESFLSR